MTLNVMKEYTGVYLVSVYVGMRDLTHFHPSLISWRDSHGVVPPERVEAEEKLDVCDGL